MKTVFLNCSPKKKLSASGYFLNLQRQFVSGQKVTETLRGRGDHQRILDTLAGADALVFCLPLYVDSVPSHVLPFLREMERFCAETHLKLRIYVVSNNGFIEGSQNRPLMQVFRNFCAGSGLTWCGGIGIGGGVMLHVTGILLPVFAGIFLLNVLLSALLGTSPLPACQAFLVQVLVLLFLNAGVLYHAARMGRCIRNGTPFREAYTRILLPSFVFILLADLFFLIISIFKGGLFRGWLAKKEIS